MSSEQEAPRTGALKASPSLLYNNLTSCGDFLAYGHHREVRCMETASVLKKQLPGNPQLALSAAESIHSVVFFTVDGEKLLAVASGMGLQVWKDAGAHLVYHWVVPSKQQKQQSDVHSGFARGICLASTEGEGLLLCVGTSSGMMYLFSIDHGGDNFNMIKELDGHQTPVLCLGSTLHSSRVEKSEETDVSTVGLFSSEEAGKVLIWECDPLGLFIIKHAINSPFPCISIGARKSCLILGRQTGLVEIYSLVVAKKLAEFRSHSRFMTALDIHPHKDLIATASQDCTMTVWSIPFDSLEQIKPVLSRCWNNRMMTGIAFCGDDFDEVAMVAYDSEEIMLCKLQS